MKRLLSFLLCCFTAVTLFAQTSGSSTEAVKEQFTVKGQLAGPAENDPLPYATISVAKEGATDHKNWLPTKRKFFGFFRRGKYVFTFQFIG